MGCYGERWICEEAGSIAPNHGSPRSLRLTLSVFASTCGRRTRVSHLDSAGDVETPLPLKLVSTNRMLLCEVGLPPNLFQS